MRIIAENELIFKIYMEDEDEVKSGLQDCKDA